MSDERVTIRELARLSGVSVGTVSRALNGYTDVRSETRERILPLVTTDTFCDPAARAKNGLTVSQMFAFVEFFDLNLTRFGDMYTRTRSHEIGSKTVVFW